MAVAPSSAVSPARKTTSKKRKSMEAAAKPEMDTDVSQSVLDTPKPQTKRTKSPGVRVKGVRVYDSANGKTCHQCRQKTLDFAASCKNMKNDKPCKMKLCHKCLLNRYGEKAEEVALLEDWKCPKCRGICNCSFCMKKRGQSPTGILIHSAKASGFSSVSEMLDVGGTSQEEIANRNADTVSSPKKIGKENKNDGSQNNIPACPLQTHSKKFKNVEHIEKKGANDVKNESKEMGVAKKVDNKELTDTCQVNEVKKKNSTKRKKVKESTEISDVEKTTLKELAEVCDAEAANHALNVAKKVNNNELTDTCQVNEVKKKNSTERKKVKESTETNNVEKANLKELAEICDAEGANRALNKVEGSGIPQQGPKKKAKLNSIAPAVLEEKPKVVEIILPEGNQITNVAGTDLQPEDVGNALQLIEFCSIFGEALEIRKGLGEIVLRDLILRRTKRGRSSTLVQFQIHLLTLIREDREEDSEVSPLSAADGEDCWLNLLKDFVTEAEGAATMGLAALQFDKTDAYELLTISEKLKLLVFICDEALQTMQVRNRIKEQTLLFSEKKKEAKEKLVAAKEKEKLMKQNFLDEIAKSILAKKGAPLTISEHEALVSEMKAQSEIAHSEMLETKGLVPQYEQMPDAIRIKPVLVDSKGHACWRLKGSKDLLRQDVQDRDGNSASDKWFSYEDKDVQVVNEYASISRLQKQKQKLAPKINPHQIIDLPTPVTTNYGTL